MNILLCNYRYFLTGGPERYMFNLTSLLESKGHKVIPFSFKYTKNVTSEFSKYFATPPISLDIPYLGNIKIGIDRKIKLFFKLIYNHEAKVKIAKVIRDQKIDIVHTLQIVNFLYPSIIDGCKELGVPVIFTCFDYQLLCPNYTFFCKDKICQKCKVSYFYAIKNKCLKNSYLISSVKVLAMFVQRFLKINERIDVFVTNSNFLKDKMIYFGFDGSKIQQIPVLVDADRHIPTYDNNSYILYVGNISKKKGVRYLVEAFRNIKTDVKLKIVGEVRDEEGKRLKRNYCVDRDIKNIEFLGFKSGKELDELYQGAIFVVFPSQWYEAGAHVILEAMSFGKPLIGMRLGSTKELIEDGVDGLLCEPGNIDDLSKKMQYLFNNPQLVIRMGECARRKVEEIYNPQIHYQCLMEIYNSVLSRKSSFKKV